VRALARAFRGAANDASVEMSSIDFNAGPKRGQRYSRLPYDPVPTKTKIQNLYSVDHQVLGHHSSECWRERVNAELTFAKKLESDSKLAKIQKIKDRARVTPSPSLGQESVASSPLGRSASVELRRTKGLPQVHREKPLEPYRQNSLRSIPPRTFIGERNFKKVANYRNVSQFSFSGMDGHSFVNNPRLRYSTTGTLAHSDEAVMKIGTENPSITSDRVRLIHNKTFK